MNKFDEFVDGFDVEKLVRSSFGITDDFNLEDGITMGYNDLINYTKLLITSTMSSMEDNLKSIMELEEDEDNSKLFLN